MDKELDELMGTNKDKPMQDDIGIGLKWEKPNCIDCKHNLGRDCAVYKCHRLLCDVDIFNCPSFEEKDETKAKKLFGV